MAAKEKDMICDIFIKTYPADYPWLKYCLRSIGKFASGFRKTLIISPTTYHDSIGLGFDWVWQERAEYGLGYIPFDGYLSQQVFKLHADIFSDAEYILYMDSDTIFTRPVTPETFFIDSKIAWLYTPYAKIKTPWQPITEKFLGCPVKFEFMRRHPLIAPSWLLAAVRTFCRTTHGVSLDKYIMAQPQRAFSEFNALGALAYYFHRDMFHWLDTETDDIPELTTLQKWSYGGLKPDIVAEFEGILGK